MTSQPITVRLQPRRLEQLKAIAAALDLSVAEAVSHMIREKIAAGVIPDAIPGVIVRRVGDAVSIQIDDNEPATVAVDTARKIVETLRSVANGGTGIVELQPFDASKSFAVTKQGTGIKVQIPYHGPTAKKLADAPSFSADLTHDLASLIERAA
ncbi:hypothetical protein [Mesorhizobium sp. KR1-2]|uniref:hypothetical protein n=1 Tax=Mesorhizobium sp. KR1-2 TaxID=3156609 RepID=UPI0032B61CC9